MGGYDKISETEKYFRNLEKNFRERSNGKDLMRFIRVYKEPIKVSYSSRSIHGCSEDGRYKIISLSIEISMFLKMYYVINK